MGFNITQFGSLDYGRNNGVLKDVENFTDVFPVYGGDSYTMTDNYMTGRANNLATYRNRNFFNLIDGLNIALQYQGKMKVMETRLNALFQSKCGDRKYRKYFSFRKTRFTKWHQ